MEEKETGKNLYEYRLSLSYENPIEAEAIRLIRERDRLECPTIKLFLLKKMLCPPEADWSGKEAEKGVNESYIQKLYEIAEEIKTLKKEIEVIKTGQSKGMLRETPEISEIPAETLQEEPSDQMDLSGFDAIADNLLSDME